MSLPPSSLKKEFIDLFNSVASHQHRYTVFTDFVTVAAISFHNAITKSKSLEEEYMQIIGKYSREDVERFPKLLGLLIELLEPGPTDILGQLYMELEFGNDRTGQFFTPPHLSELLAKLLHGDDLADMTKPFITMSDPCCGAGGMVLAFVKEMLNHKHDPANKLWVQCIDVDRTAAMMCYLQLTLWNVPAQVLVGNTLSMKMQEQLFTPAHYLNGWEQKLKLRRMVDIAVDLEKPSDKPVEQESTPVTPSVHIVTDGRQLDLFDDS